jgi:betaine-homocysteine S-methyltransferase
MPCGIDALFSCFQVRWSKEEGVDYIIAETFSFLAEAEIALDVILSFGLPAVVTLSVADNPVLKTLDGVPIGRACRTLLDKGATLVGSNCNRGPNTMLKVIEDIVKEVPPEKVCALPVMYRTTEEHPTFFDFNDKCCPVNNPVYPHGLDAFQVSTREVTEFTKRCKDMGLKYMGLCCGNTGNYTRAMAEALGRKPPASKYLDLHNKGINPALLCKK